MHVFIIFMVKIWFFFLNCFYYNSSGFFCVKRFLLKHLCLSHDCTINTRNKDTWSIVNTFENEFNKKMINVYLFKHFEKIDYTPSIMKFWRNILEITRHKNKLRCNKRKQNPTKCDFIALQRENQLCFKIDCSSKKRVSSSHSAINIKQKKKIKNMQMPLIRDVYVFIYSLCCGW